MKKNFKLKFRHNAMFSGAPFKSILLEFSSIIYATLFCVKEETLSPTRLEVEIDPNTGFSTKEKNLSFLLVFTNQHIICSLVRVLITNYQTFTNQIMKGIKGMHSYQANLKSHGSFRSISTTWSSVFLCSKLLRDDNSLIQWPGKKMTSQSK